MRILCSPCFSQAEVNAVFKQLAIMYGAVTLEMRPPPQIFKVQKGGVWCVSHWLVWRSSVLQLILQYFIVRENLSVLAHWGLGERSGPSPVVHSLSVLGECHIFSCQCKRILWEILRETIFPQVLWYLVSFKNTTGHVLPTFGFAFSILIGLVFSQMVHFEGKLWLSPLYHWD